MSQKNVVLCIERSDNAYTYRTRKYFKGCNIKNINSKTDLLSIINRTCKDFKSTRVVCTNRNILIRLVREHDPRLHERTITIDKYKGSIFHNDGVDYLILPSFKMLTYSPIADWLFTRWTNKLLRKNSPAFPPMHWNVAEPHNIDTFLAKAKDALLISVDVETTRKLVDPKMIEGDPKAYRGIWAIANMAKSGKKKMLPMAPIVTMVGYSCLFQHPNGELYSETIVIPLKDMVAISYMRLFNNLPAAKIMQNGGYDSTYFLRYGAPLHNYIYDTFTYMHSWLVEMPRTLAFIASIFDRNYIYWKDDGENNMMEYNAKDCHNTLWAMVYMLNSAPDYALKNYNENFRMVFPCIHSGAEGWKIDMEERKTLHVERLKAVNNDLDRLGKLVAKGFNPNSPKQCLILLKGLGFKKAKDTNDKTLQVFIDSHPIYEVVGNLISDVRTNRKANSTYFEASLMDGRMLYELNACGTDTGRLASKGSNLWVGTQIQNVPLYAKSMYVADWGWGLNAADYAQSESRCTAYISEDSNLLEVVEDEKDFHKNNATMFFGIPYEDITKAIRTTGKKVNHGANYNMGWRVLLETMGRRAVLNAANLLRLPRSMTVKQICEYLLNCFDTAYPDVRGKYYTEVKNEIADTGMLVGATGWTRRCFGDPDSAKHTLNSYVAHAPQSLSVKKINEAYFNTWRYQIKHETLRLKAQVHDEIIWQDKEKDRVENCRVVREYMEVPTTVRGREMLIPADFSIGAISWKELKDD